MEPYKSLLSSNLCHMLTKESKKLKHPECSLVCLYVNPGLLNGLYCTKVDTSLQSQNSLTGIFFQYLSTKFNRKK